MTTDDFRQAMAHARVVVVPLQPNLLHLGGQQTYLNAMAMGKPVIVGDNRGAPDYLTDGVTGLIIPPADPAALQAALIRLLSDDAFRQALGRQAAAAITDRDYSTEGCMRKVTELAESLTPGTGSPV